MDTRLIASEYRMQSWAGIIKDCKESGLSIRTYCKNAGIHENTYFYWQKKLREAVYKEMTKEENKMTGLMSSKQNEITNLQQASPGTENLSLSKWAKVDIKSTSEAESATNTNIKISRDGWTVTISSTVDPHLLTETLRAVSRACC